MTTRYAFYVGYVERKLGMVDEKTRTKVVLNSMLKQYLIGFYKLKQRKILFT